VIPHGLPRPDPEGEEPRLPRASLLYVGVAGHRKRIALLPAILERVRRAHPDARLRVVGFAPDAAPGLREDFARRGLADAVDWAGILPPRRVAAAYRAADLLVAPAAYEGIPLAVLEAMQHAVPVVATDIAGHAAVVEDGVTGHLAAIDDVATIAALCSALLRDGRRRRALGDAAARAVRERFDFDRHVRAYRDLYERVCADTARGIPAVRGRTA
jgi:glycosyltransferase involved in cell wall biosynthesis